MKTAAYGAAYSASISATGGSGKYSWVVNKTTIPTTGVATTIASGGGLTGANTGSATLTLAGKPNAYNTITLAVTVTDTTAKTSVSATLKITVYSLAVSVDADTIPQGMAGMPLTFGNLTISGGKKPYTIVYSHLPAGLSADTYGVVRGTPTTVGATTVGVAVNDSSTTKQLGATTFVLRVVAATTPASNNKLNGQYACTLDRSWDAGVKVSSNGSTYTLYRGGMALAFTANGSGKITGGEADQNGPGSGYKMVSGLAGTYAIGADNRGYINIGSGSALLAVAGGNTNSSGIFTELSLVEMDDAGTSPSGKHGGGHCYRQNALNTSGTNVLKGTRPTGSYVFLTQGETGSGARKSVVGRVVFSGSTMSGIEDDVNGTTLKANQTIPSLTVSTADSYGRVVISYAGVGNMVIYLTGDAKGNAMMMTMTSHSGSSSADFQLGQTKAQVAANIKASAPLKGNMVLYAGGSTTSSNTASPVYLALTSRLTGSATAKSFTFNSVAANAGGSFTMDASNKLGLYGKSFTYTSDTTTGRTTLTGVSGVVMYLVNTGQAAILFGAPNGTGRQNFAGWLEPQIGPGSWAVSEVAANYFLSKTPNGDPDASSTSATFGMATDGTIKNFTEDDGSAYWASWSEPLSGTPGLAGSGKVQLNTADGAKYGVMDIKITVGSYSGVQTTCYTISENAATSSATKGKLACIDRSSESPKVDIIQE